MLMKVEKVLYFFTFFLKNDIQEVQNKTKNTSKRYRIIEKSLVYSTTLTSIHQLQLRQMCCSNEVVRAEMSETVEDSEAPLRNLETP